MPEFLIIFSIIVTILWLIIGWRAMRAHENISYTLKRYVASQETDKSAEFRKESATANRLYKKFISEQPENLDLTPKERHDAFREWLDKYGEF